jgi:hypothetical protein
VSLTKNYHWGTGNLILIEEGFISVFLYRGFLYRGFTVAAVDLKMGAKERLVRTENINWIWNLERMNQGGSYVPPRL